MTREGRNPTFSELGNATNYARDPRYANDTELFETVDKRRAYAVEELRSFVIDVHVM